MANVFRGLFLGIDKIIYNVVGAMFQLIIDLANFELFSNDVIKEFRNRIYLILGIVMVFKLIISFIQILINPDDISDKEKGVTGIFRRVIISMLLIVLVPSIFDTAKKIQNFVVPFIPKVVLSSPVDISTDSTDESVSMIGQKMAYYSFLPFFYYSDDACNNGSLNIGDSNSTPTINYVSDITYDIATEKQCPQASDGYRYNYRLFLSTIAGIYLLYTLIFVAKDVAVRAIKFGLCQIIAPIPIATYIDPKLSKQSFDNWVSTTVKVYLSLFVNLISIFFVLYVFQLLFTGEGNVFQQIIGQFGKTNFWRATLVTWFIIAALFRFAKDMPKFISDMLGIKDGFTDIGAIFKGAGGLFASNVGATVAGLGNFANGMKTGRGVVGSLGSAAAGWASARFHGGRAALNGKGFKDVWNTSTQGTWTRRQNRFADKVSGVTRRGRAEVAVRDYLQIADDVSLAEGTLKSLNEMHGNVGKSKQASFGVLDKYASHIGFNSGSKGSKNITDNLIKTFQDNADAAMQNATLSKYFERDANGNITRNVNRSALENISLNDMLSIASAGTTAGIGAFNSFNKNGEMGLAAYKALHQDIISGQADVRNGKGNDILNHKDVVTSREGDLAFIRKNAANLAGIVVGNVKLMKPDELTKAYLNNQAAFDDAVQARISDIQSKIAENYDAVNRSANQRDKNQNKSEK